MYIFTVNGTRPYCAFDNEWDSKIAVNCDVVLFFEEANLLKASARLSSNIRYRPTTELRRFPFFTLRFASYDLQ